MIINSVTIYMTGTNDDKDADKGKSKTIHFQNGEWKVDGPIYNRDLVLMSKIVALVKEY